MPALGEESLNNYHYRLIPNKNLNNYDMSQVKAIFKDPMKMINEENYFSGYMPKVS